MKGKNKVLTILVMVVMMFMLPANASAATVGSTQLRSPEFGWQRYDDRDNNFFMKEIGGIVVALILDIIMKHVNIALMQLLKILKLNLILKVQN